MGAASPMATEHPSETAPRHRPSPSPVPDPDAALIESLRRHEESAVETLVAAYAGRVFRLALRITGNTPDAEEVVQDALWSATSKVETFRGSSALGSWIYRIAANAAYQKRRARRHERQETSWEDWSIALDEASRMVPVGVDWSPRLEDPALQSELQSVLRAAIDELPNEHRATFLLHDVEGLSNPEIASTLHIKTAVKSRVHRARLFLRGRLAVYLGGVAELT